MHIEHIGFLFVYNHHLFKNIIETKKPHLNR